MPPDSIAVESNPHVPSGWMKQKTCVEVRQSGEMAKL